MSILETLVAGAVEDALDRRAQAPLEKVQALARERGTGRSLIEHLHASTEPRFITEIKRASPSAGVLSKDLDPTQLAQTYEAGGAAAISVLTEARQFGGSLGDLAQVAATVNIPVLRKDFLVQPYQLWEARAHGADLVLLIVAALEPSMLGTLLTVASEAGCEALVEVHTDDEMKQAIDAGARLVGINARNLSTFDVDLGVVERVARLAPSGVLLVAESGIQTREDVLRLHRAGCQAFLVGSTLVTAQSPREKLAELQGSR